MLEAILKVNEYEKRPKFLKEFAKTKRAILTLEGKNLPVLRSHILEVTELLNEMYRYMKAAKIIKSNEGKIIEEEYTHTQNLLKRLTKFQSDLEEVCKEMHEFFKDKRPLLPILDKIKVLAEYIESEPVDLPTVDEIEEEIEEAPKSAEQKPYEINYEGMYELLEKPWKEKLGMFWKGIMELDRLGEDAISDAKKLKVYEKVAKNLRSNGEFRNAYLKLEAGVALLPTLLKKHRTLHKQHLNDTRWTGLDQRASPLADDLFIDPKKHVDPLLLESVQRMRQMQRIIPRIRAIAEKYPDYQSQCDSVFHFSYLGRLFYEEGKFKEGLEYIKRAQHIAGELLVLEVRPPEKNKFITPRVGDLQKRLEALRELLPRIEAIANNDPPYKSECDAVVHFYQQALLYYDKKRFREGIENIKRAEHLAGELLVVEARDPAGRMLISTKQRLNYLASIIGKANTIVGEFPELLDYGRHMRQGQTYAIEAIRNKDFKKALNNATYAIDMAHYILRAEEELKQRPPASMAPLIDRVNKRFVYYSDFIKQLQPQLPDGVTFAWPYANFDTWREQTERMINNRDYKFAQSALKSHIKLAHIYYFAQTHPEIYIAIQKRISILGKIMPTVQEAANYLPINDPDVVKWNKILDAYFEIDPDSMYALLSRKNRRRWINTAIHLGSAIIRRAQKIRNENK